LQHWPVHGDAVTNHATPKHTTLRDEHVEVTRRSVLGAVSRLLEHKKREDISFAAVANEAQVSVRTVYRHFPTRDDLFNAHWKYINSEIELPRIPGNEAELMKLIPETIQRYSEYEKLIHAYFVPEQGRDLAKAMQPQIREAMLKVVEAADHHQLDPQTMRWAAAVINCVWCLRGWLSLTEDWEMDAQEASDVTTWAARVILDGLREQGSAKQPAHRKS
jgi:AcrR family transcriptional regulator